MKKDSKPLILTFFKENFASRTFEVPVNWVYQFGGFLILISIVTFLTFGLAIRFYFESHPPLPAHEEITAKAPEKKGVVEASPVVAPSVPSAPLVPVASPTVVHSAVAVSTPVPSPVASVVSVANISLLDITRGLIDKSLPQPADIRVELEKAKPRMSDGHLYVDSAIRYVADDGEIQRGYILILVHTPKGLISYPNRALTGKKETPQVEASAGEFFAVGRYREIHAEFESIHSLSEVKKIELLLISNEKKLLTSETWVP